MKLAFPWARRGYCPGGGGGIGAWNPHVSNERINSEDTVNDPSLPYQPREHGVELVNAVHPDLQRKHGELSTPVHHSVNTGRVIACEMLRIQHFFERFPNRGCDLWLDSVRGGADVPGNESVSLI